jgi:DNA-binding PadR family transcriptional regulator
MLTQQLCEMEHDGLIERTVYAQVPPKVEYRLTALGETLLPVLEAMYAWAHKPEKAPRALSSLRRTQTRSDRNPSGAACQFSRRPQLAPNRWRGRSRARRGSCRRRGSARRRHIGEKTANDNLIRQKTCRAWARE